MRDQIGCFLPSIHAIYRKESLTESSYNIMEGGRIHDSKLMEIFALLIIQLELVDSTLSSRLTKSVGYLFTSKAAVKAMKALQLQIPSVQFTTGLSYKINLELAWQLLDRFFDAHLLHCPLDRTVSKVPQSLTASQPTAKGVAVTDQFARLVGVGPSAWPVLLLTSYNLMNLIPIPRHPIEDTPILLDNLISVVFQLMMGPFCNVWDAVNPPDPIGPPPGMPRPRQSTNPFLLPGEVGAIPNRTKSVPQLLLKRSRPEHVLPYHHRYYTNPELDSHTQYYTSRVGLRFMKQVVCLGVKINNVFSGKALCQWLIDCTDISTLKQAIEMGQRMLIQQLICPVKLAPSKSLMEAFSSHRQCLYTLGPKGQSMVHWVPSPRRGIRQHKEEWLQSYVASETPGKLDLPQVILDPGYCLLFQLYLDSERARENLDAYLKLQAFRAKTEQLARAVRACDHNTVKLVAKECKLLAFHIFVTFIADNLPFMVNVDSLMRSRATAVFMDPEMLGSDDETFLHTPVAHTYDEAEKLQREKEDTPGLRQALVAPPSYSTCGLTEVFGIEAPEELAQLAQITLAFNDISTHIYRLMETDSFPRFGRSSYARTWGLSPRSYC